MYRRGAIPRGAPSPSTAGIRYRSYDDTIPRGKYLERTGEWVRRASAALRADGSLFLTSGPVKCRTMANRGVERPCRGNTWFIPYETIQNREKDRPHPATFPPKLPAMCLRHGLDRIRTVADPSLGLGSTAVACAQLGIGFVGIEMDEGYLQEAVDRTRAALA